MIFNVYSKRKIIAAVVAIALTATFLIPSIAKSAGSASADALSSIKIKSAYGVLMDADSGNIIYDKGGDEKIYPASTSKILTCIVAIENSEMDDVVTVSQNALKGQANNGAHIGLKAGEKLSMEDALYGMMLESANDAAIAIAETISGSEEEFAKLLNEKAKELGLENSHFVTPNGLYDDDHYTTARDLAVITKYAMENDEFMKIFSSYKHILSPTNMRSDSLDIYTSHKMTKYKSMEYDGVIGGKTGYVDESKCNVVTAAERDGMTLICVTARCDNIIDAYNDSTALLNGGFANYASMDVSPVGGTGAFDDMIADGGYKISHSSLAGSTMKAVLPKDADTSQITFKINDNDVAFPIKEGEVTGQMQAVYDGNIVGVANITAEKDMGFFGYAFSIVVKIILAVVIIMAVTIIALRIHFTSKRKSRRMARASAPKQRI